MIDYCVIGKRIKNARLALGLTQEMLSEKVSVSTNYLSKIEGGHEKPNLEMLCKISNATNASLVELMTGTVEEQQYLQKDIAKILDKCSPQKVRLIYDIILRIAEDE